MSLPPSDRPLSRGQQRQRQLAETSLLPALRPTTMSGAVVAMAAALAVLWVLVAVDAVLNHPLLRYGIKPRESGGLIGVLLAPLLHTGAGQLAADTIPLAVFGWLMLISGGRYFSIVTAAVWLASGLTSWLAAPAHHVILGSSGVVFGWLGYVLARAWFGRKIVWIAIGVIVLCVFSSMLSGLLPRLGEHTFWGGSLAGFVVGVGLAAGLHRTRRGDRPKAALP